MSARFPVIKNSPKRDFREPSRPGIEPLEMRIAPAALAHNIDLSSLDGTNGGFKLSGGAGDDHVGASVSNAGDVNGDGLDDVIIGSAGADEGYVVFGSRSGFPADLDLSTLDGTNGGFKLQGGSASRASTIEVSAAGDFNGDGYADLIIGIKNESPNERLDAGESYLVFGKSSGFGTVDLLSLDGTNGGFRIYGANSGDRSGASVSAAGDFNGDGFDDLVIGAYRASNYSNISSGESYLLFGKPSGFATVDLAALNGSNGGFKLRGGAAYDSSGFSVSGIGDFNGDGLADIVIGAREADPSAHTDAGQSYVVFGKKAGFGTVELASLDGTNGGFALDGANSSDHLGHSVSGAGDVNGDGFDDLIVGAPAATSTYEGALQAGVSYVVFGKASGFTSVKLSSLDGTNGGFIINGGQEYTQSGFSVSGAGDIDGDGFDDLIIGAPMVASGSDYPGGQSFLLFGKSSGFSTVELALLDGSNGGFKLNGGAYGDHAGHSVSGAGDFNGDGLDDIIIGANDTVANDHSGAGKSYILFGFQDSPPNVTYPDLTITQFTDNKTSAAVRDTLAYDIDFFNAGTEDASGVTIIQTLPQGTYFNASENSGWVQSDDNLIYYVESLGAGTGSHAALLLHVYNTAEAGIDELVSNVSIVDDGSHGTSPTLNNTATDTDTLNAAPDLQLSVTKSGKTQPGNTLSYSLGYLNVGDQDATNVFITEKVPVGTTFDPSASTAGWVETARGSGIYQFALGTVYAGAGIPSFIIFEEGPSGPPSVVFAVNVNNPAQAGIEQFTNEAAIDDDHANGPDPDLTNNSISDTSTLDAAPDLAITLHSDGVGTAHPGDTLIYTIGYANHGNQIATGVTIVETLPAGTRFVASENPGWTLNGSTLTYNLGSVAPQSITTLFENFDNNAVNTLPAGWNTFASGSEVWTTVTPTSSSSPNSAFAPNTSEASDLSLVSPTIHLSDESGQQLSFKNRFNIENGFDGAILEISIDGGAFNDILDAGGSFAAGGYTDTISSEFDNSIGGRQAWSGDSGGFINSVVNLPAASLEHDVQFRWRIASDSIISYEGWNIDDVAFTKPAPASTLALTLHVDSPAGPGLTRIISKATISDDGANGLDPTADNSKTDTDVVSATADLSVSISDGGVAPVPGGNLAYTLNYANSGDRSVTGVKLKQTLPAGTTFDPAASSSGWTQVFGGTYEYDLGTLNGGGTSGSVAFVVHVTSPAAAGLETLSTTVSIDSSQEDPANGPDGFPSDNIASKTTALNAAPDLRLLATDNGNPGINPGETVVYALKYSNAGNQHTAGVVISEAVPAGTSFNPSASTPGWTTGDGIHYTFPVGTLNAGDNGSVNFALTANNPYTNGNSISDTAAIDDNHASGLDANPADNSSTDTTPVLLGGDLSITKTDGALTAVPGALVTYTITVGNSSAGAQTAFNTKVTDAFPASLAGVTYTASGAGGATGFTTSGGGNINDIVALPVGSTITYIVKGTLLPSATGTLVNTATVTPDPSFTDNNPLNNSATDTDTLTPQADLQITKTDDKTSAVPGTANTYTIVVSNSGPSDVTGARVVDTFTTSFLTGVTYTTSATGGANGFSSGAGNIDQFVNLPSGSSITYTVNGIIASNAVGTLNNTASVTAPNGVSDSTLGNNNAVDTDTLTPQADLQITKTDGKTSAVPGTATTYTIVVSNSGPSDVSGATIADTFPGIFGGVTYTAAQTGGASGFSNGSGNLNQTVNMPSGSTITYTVLGTISAAATGTLSNTATITAPAGVTDSTLGNNSAVDTDTLTPQADLQITKTDGKTSAVPGTANTYTIVVSNSGPSDVSGATIADAFPGIFGGVTYTATQTGGASGFSNGNGNLNQTVNMPSGSTITYTVLGTISATATGTLSNTATITAPAGVTDSTLGNNSAVDADTLTPQADLQITKTDGKTSAVPGTANTYTIVVSNSGPSDVTGATIADTFPGIFGGVTYTATQTGGASGFSNGSGNLSQTVNMPSGSTITYTVLGTISAGATGTLSNTATITAPAGVTDGNLANNSATDSDALGSQADLQITKTDGKTSAVPGTANTYTIVVNNSGPSDVSGATIADTFPGIFGGVTYTATQTGGANGFSNGSGNLSQTVNLPSGSTITYTVLGTISAGATGTLSNTATITAPAGVTDSTPGNNSAVDTDTLTPQADLQITKTDGKTSAVPGTANTYTIVVTNSGPSDVSGATIADTFPGIFGGVTYTATQTGGASGFSNGSGNLSQTVNLPSGSTITYTVLGTINAGATGTLSNTATITAPAGVTDSTLGNNSAVDADTLTPQADLQITKTDGKTSAVPGTANTYTIVVSNSGPSDVNGATIADTFPGIFGGVTYTATQTGGASGFSNGSGNLNQTVNMPSGSTITYTVLGTISAGATGTLSNTATITAPAGVTDSTLGNNSAVDTDTLTPQADLQITKTDGKTSAVPGTANTYTIVVTNSGPSDVNGATIADTFPGIFGGVTYTATQTGGASGFSNGSGNLSQTVNLPSGSTITYTVLGTISAGATGTLSNTATITAPAGVTDSTLTNNTATDTDTLTPQADLQIIKTDNKTSTIPGTANSYTITVTNAGPSDVIGATITDSFPGIFTGVTYTAAQTGGATGIANGNGDLNQTVNMPSGSTITYTVLGNINAAATGSLTNTAAVALPAGVADLDTTNNSATDVDVLTPHVDLQVTKSDNKTTAVPGTPNSYTIVVTNAGPSDVSGVTIEEYFRGIPVPVFGGTNYTATATGGASGFADGSGDIFQTVNMPAGSTITYVLTGIVNSAATGTLVNTATVTAPAGVVDDNSANNSASDSDILTPQTDLAITQSDSPDPIFPGTTLTYVIHVSNSGPSDANGATIADTLPQGLSSVHWSAVYAGGAAGNDSGDGNISESANVPIGGTIVYTVTGTVDLAAAGTTLSNTVSINAASETQLGNNTAFSQTYVYGDDLKLTKSDNATTVTPGSMLTYKLNYNNVGYSTALGVVVTERVPAGTVFNPGASSAGWTETTSGSGIFTLNVGKLERGEEGSANFAVDVNGVAVAGLETIVNTASIADDGTFGPDLNPGDNSVTDSDVLEAAPDLLVVKTSDALIAKRGGVLTYTLSYSNIGNQDATGAFLIEHLPLNSTLDVAGSDSRWTLQADGSYRLDLGNLAGGAAAGAVSFAAKVLKVVPGGVMSISNVGRIADDGDNGLDLNPGNNSSNVVTNLNQGIYAVSTAADLIGICAKPIVRVYDAATNLESFHFKAYSSHRDGVRLAVGDINGDGIDDIVTSSSFGSGQVRVFNGLDGKRLAIGDNRGSALQLNPFDGKKEKGAYVASGDVNGDGRDDIIVGSGANGGSIKVYSGKSGALLSSYLAFNQSFKGGVSVAVGDVNGDGIEDIIASQATAGGTVTVYKGAQGELPAALDSLTSFQVGGASYRGGVTAAAADLDGDGKAELIVGRMSGAPSAVEIYSGADSHLINSILPFGPEFKTGVRVAAVDVNFDGIADIVVGGGGKSASQVRIFDGKSIVDASATATELNRFTAFSRFPNIALVVAGSSPAPSVPSVRG